MQFERLKDLEGVLVGGSGDLSDLQYLFDELEHVRIREGEHDDGHHLNGRELWAYLTRVMYARRSKGDPLYNQLILADVQDGKVRSFLFTFTPPPPPFPPPFPASLAFSLASLALPRPSRSPRHGLRGRHPRHGLRFPARPPHPPQRVAPRPHARPGTPPLSPSLPLAEL